MSLKDVSEKRLEDYADVFADIVNVLLFDGSTRILASQVKTALPRSIYKADGKIHEQERDVAKYWEVEGINIALLGLENQTSIMKEMPVRILSYDGANYRQALNDIQTAKDQALPIPPLYPVVTLVLYFGDRRWNHPCNLKGILQIPEGFEDYVSDYRINLFEIQYLTDEQVSMFRSDFRLVAELFTQERKLREGLISEITLSNIEIVHVKEVLELLKVMTGDDRFEDAFNEEVKGGHLNMYGRFGIIDYYEEKGRKEEKERADRAEERAKKAELRASRADERASRADERANRADERANKANEMARNADARAKKAEEELARLKAQFGKK